LSLRQRQKMRSVKGYSWLYLHKGPSWVIGLLVTVIVVGMGALIYSWYCQLGNDVAPDSLAGFCFAIAGTICILLAATLYVIRRRSRRLAMGKLNTALNWHIFFAVMGIAFILMHSFGNFNAKTGTYALYGLIALMVSGFVGRMLDRIMPWLIANEVDTILTAQGEDRVAHISRSLQTQADAAYATPMRYPHPTSPAQLQDFPAEVGQGPPNTYYREEQSLSMPWDMAFITPVASPGEVTREEDTYNFMSNRHGIPVQPGVLMYQARQHIAEIHTVERAMQREQFYRYVIRYWRVFHIALALLAIGLITWHLVYVGELVLNTFISHR
jgi:hypothetical protein